MASLEGAAAMLAGFPVAVRHSEAQGRFVVAARDLRAGEEVFCGWAPVTSLFEAYHKRVCACCLCWGPSGSHRLCCKACHWAFYCSNDCQETHTALHRPWCSAHKRVTRADDKFGKGTSAMLRTLLEAVQFAVLANLPREMLCQTQQSLDRARAKQLARLQVVVGDVQAAYRAREEAEAAVQEQALLALVERHTGVSLAPSPGPQRPEITPDAPLEASPPQPSFKLDLPRELFRAAPQPAADAECQLVWGQHQLLCHTALPKDRVKEWQAPLQFLQSLVDGVDLACFWDEPAAMDGRPEPILPDAAADRPAAPVPHLSGEAWLQLLSCVECNAFGIYNCLDPTVEAGQMVGRAVCPAASFFNHSCEPNCQRLVLCPNLISIRTVAPVVAGTELNISYIDHNVPRSTRKSQLADLYGFTCQCRLCGSQQEEPKVSYRTHGKPHGGKQQRTTKGTKH